MTSYWVKTTDRITCDRCDASILLLLQPGHEGLTMHFNLLTASSTPTPIADDKNRKAKQSSIHYCITGHLISVQGQLLVSNEMFSKTLSKLYLTNEKFVATFILWNWNKHVMIFCSAETKQVSDRADIAYSFNWDFVALAYL